ncbi:MAG: hypothetical protein HC780_25180 [Leptolyngbyaceae cyanobacterium CSU_1_3]|nr:hypothetical protein [Leptolyngbyaceae cyanobacterium CSU_1_3]
MWRRLKNLFDSLNTYADMSPDLALRRRINRMLRDRPSRTADEWYELFWQPLSVSKEVAIFVYQQMEDYSGLHFANVLPSDRLTEDLNLPLVCWFDWELSFCESFACQFGIDLSEEFDIYAFSTLQEFVVFLNQQLLPVNYS